MSPPPCQGGIASSSDARPYSTPMPVGPKTLCPENAKKSQSSAWTSTGRCGADWAPSTSVTMPRSRACETIHRTGLMVPSALDRCATASRRVRSVSRRSNAFRSSSPVSVIGTARTVAPVWAATSCQGTMFEWCSIPVIRISSPALRVLRPQLWATRLIPSVVPRVKTISRGDAALRNRATRARTPS